MFCLSLSNLQPCLQTVQGWVALAAWGTLKHTLVTGIDALYKQHEINPKLLGGTIPGKNDFILFICLRQPGFGVLPSSATSATTT